MKSRRMTIVSCLCALAATAAGAAYFTSAHTPIQMPVRNTGTSGSVSGSQTDTGRETASKQLLNAMPPATEENGRRWETVSQEGAFMQPPASGGSGMELRKPMPPPTLSPNENTDSTNQMANANNKPSSGNSDTSEEEEGGGLPPTTDKPVVDGGSGTSSSPTPESGNSSEAQPSEPEPSEPTGEEPSSGGNESSESASENSAQESSSAQSEEGTDSSQANPQSEASSSDGQAEGTSTEESQQ